MSKSIKSVANVATGGVLFDSAGKSMSPSFDGSATNEYIKFLNGYNTENTDKTLENLSAYARKQSENLGDMNGYVFDVNASDEARKEAENATYQSYLDKLNPEFERQTDDLQTRLVNQGLSVGSEAYQRAMNDLYEKQNEAKNMAAYEAVLKGQQAYTQDLNNQINAGNFANDAEQNYIDQLLSALTGSYSAYDVAGEKYNAGNALALNKYKAEQQGAQNRLSLLSGLLSAGSKFAGM